MKIKRYLAEDVPQAVAAIRRELGRDAVILSTRRQSRPGWRRLFRRFDLMEVTAAVEDSARPQPIAREAHPTAAPVAPAAPTVAAASAPVERSVPETPMPPPQSQPAAPPPPTTPALDVREAPLQVDLRQALFHRALAPAEAGAPEPIRVRPGTRRLVALVGPTGAGKTTTIAKLAAHMHLQQGWRVALITADTFRVGAVEQLAAYARLLGLQLEVTPTPGALQRALLRTEQADVVLIDTSGRGHKDTRRMLELKSFLKVAAEVAAQPAPTRANSAEAALAPGGLEVHLVVAAAMRRDEVQAVVAAYRSVVDRLLITKLDECESPPEVVAVAAESNLPLSYCTAGQRVPEDLGLAWPDRIAASLVSGSAPLSTLRTG